jgi:hypothetical protein
MRASAVHVLVFAAAAAVVGFFLVAAADVLWRPAPPEAPTDAGHVVGATNSNPIILPSWTIPAWFIDPSNTIGCAADTNSGTIATCTGGCNGSVCTSGLGPLLTFSELNVHRWGCQGNPTACPRLQQNTTVTFLSSQTSAADPVLFTPLLKSGAQLSGVLGAAQTVCAATLGQTTPKNRALHPQLLTTAFTGCTGTLAVGELIVNTTHPSRAWTALATADVPPRWNISQPLAPMTSGGSTPAEVDTWALGDQVTLYQPVAIDVVVAAPTFTDFNGPNNYLWLDGITLLDPLGPGHDNAYIGQGAALGESFSQRVLTFAAVGGTLNVLNLVNDFASEGLLNGPQLGVTNGTIQAGVLAAGLNSVAITGFGLDKDVLVLSNAVWSTQSSLGLIYLGAGVVLQTQGVTTTTSSAIIWGPGILDMGGPSRCSYLAGAGEATAIFVNTGGLELNGQSKGCLGLPASASAFATCNLAVTPANLDANLGAVSGCIGAPSGGAFCNYGP